jgi:hypothetical protein
MQHHRRDENTALRLLHKMSGRGAQATDPGKDPFMKISSVDQRCRYVPAVGTQTANSSPFGDVLKKKYGITLPAECSLERMVTAGWVRPVLRVALPRCAFDAWRNYPEFPSEGWQDCPEADRWALDLYATAMSGARPGRNGEWWVHFLDDPADPLALITRAHAKDPSDRAALPPVFRHAHTNREIRPWWDFFAYWQVFPVAETLDALTCTILLTDDVGATVTNGLPVCQSFAQAEVQAISRKWEERRAAFEWLSRMRTVLGASAVANRPWSDVSTAFRRVADSMKLTADQMKNDIRATLLVMWREWSDQRSRLAREYPALRELLRQEIQCAIFLLEQLTGEPTDFLDAHWYDARRQPNDWSNLIDALPLEQELARRDFPDLASMYLKKHAALLPRGAIPDADGLRALLANRWRDNRPLRRFVLAFDRLHRELTGEHLMASETVIRAAECIEQFLLTVLHTERVLSSIYRKRKQASKYPSLRELLRDTLNHVLQHLGLSSYSVDKTHWEKWEKRAKLHDLPKALPVVDPGDVNSGCDTVDRLVTSFANFLIARNYAAHHDALDADLIYPSKADPGQHAGHIALSSVLIAVVTTLQAATP